MGTYGDWVKLPPESLSLQGLQEEESQNDYVPAEFFTNLPDDLTELEVEEVRWVEKEFITADMPVEFLTPNVNYNLYVVPGSILRVQEDVKIQAVVDGLKFEDEAPDTSSIEIRFDNGFLEGPNLRRLILTHLKGTSARGWNFAYLKRQTDGQDQWDFFDGLGIFEGQLRFSLSVDEEGRNAVLRLLDEEGNEITRLQRQLSTPLYSATEIMGLTVVSGPQSSAEMSELSLSYAPDGEYRETETQETLRSLAEVAGITIGTEGEAWYMTSEPRKPYDIVFRDLLRKEFNQLTPGGSFEWRWLIRPARDVYNFAYPDLLVGFAARNEMQFRAYLLPTGNHPEQGTLPDWLFSGSYSSGELRQIIEDHIRTVVSRYQGEIQEWTVFAETIWDGRFVEDNFWRQRIAGGDTGTFEDYIADVYNEVKTVDPDGKTIYEFVIYHFPNRDRVQGQLDAVYQHLSRLKAKGAPIDALGIEMHLRPAVYRPGKEELITDMQRFSELGLEVIVMEMDVNMYGVEGTKQERQAYQAQVYREVLEACLESGVCPSFTLWGFKYPLDAWLLGPEYP